MRVACVGGGPASLYLAILLKRRDPAHEVTVYERDPAGSTYGWGVTYWENLLDRLHGGDPESARAVREASVGWRDGVAHVRGATTVHRGDQGFGIGRHRLLALLAERAAALGVRLVYGHPVDGAAPPDADLVVAGDGVGSALRGRHAAHYGTRVREGRNVYTWLGTDRVFDAFTFAFVETPHGWIWCYGYGFDDRRSTCVVECAPETWRGLGLDRAGGAEGPALLARLFEEPLAGHRLFARNGADGADESAPARWQRFRTVTNRTWHRGSTVLVGDAAHTTHYSIGAGTSLALDDALALDAALGGCGVSDLRGALARYERERRAALVPAQSAARYSARWYEHLPRYVRLPPHEMFALLGQRHSPLLPYVPPRLYYFADTTATRLPALRTLKHHLGPHLARALHPRDRPTP